MKNELRVLYVEPEKLPQEMIIENSLEKKQELVGGLIEYANLLDDNEVLIICNEEGKILGLPYNRDIGHDIIAGSFILVGNDTRLGEDISLTDKQIEKYTKVFDKDSITKTKDRVNQILLNDMCIY